MEASLREGDVNDVGDERGESRETDEGGWDGV